MINGVIPAPPSLLLPLPTPPSHSNNTKLSEFCNQTILFLCSVLKTLLNTYFHSKREDHRINFALFCIFFQKLFVDRTVRIDQYTIAYQTYLIT